MDHAAKPRLRFRPTQRFLGLLLLGLVPAAFVAWSPSFALITALVDLILLGLFAWDLYQAMQARQATIRRIFPETVTRAAPFSLRVEAFLSRRSGGPISLDVTNRFPPSFSPAEYQGTLRVQGSQPATLEFKMQPHKRGEFAIMPLVAAQRSPLGLLEFDVKTTGPEHVHVFPNIQSLAQFDSLARQRHLHHMGLGRVRQRGDGTEISGLRAYAPGDPYSRIDWKATARRVQPVVREMAAERRQTVVILLDCGRRMARETHNRSQLDLAIETTLLLSHVVLRSDDRVGLMAFADTILEVVPPLRGHASASVISRAVTKLDPVLREPAYGFVAAAMMRHFPRRTLTVLFTDAIEPTALDSLTAPVRFLSSRHLMLCVVFRDPTIARALASPLASNEELYRAGAAAQIALERERGLQRLRQAGAMVLEVSADQLSTAVVNEYLQIKARHLL